MSRAEKINKYRYYYALMDFLVLSVSFLFTVYTMMLIHNINTDKLATPVLPVVMVLFMLSILLIFEFNRLYTVDVIKSRKKQLTAVLKSLAAGSIYIFSITLLILSIDLTEVGILVLAFSAVAFSLLYIVRIELLRTVILREKTNHKKILIIGDGEPGQKIAAAILGNDNSGLTIAGILDNTQQVGKCILPGVDIIGEIDELESIVGAYNIDEIIISYDSISYNELLEITGKCLELNIKTKIASDLIKVIPGHFRTETYFGIPVVDFSLNHYSPELKRFVDVLLSIAGIIVLMPLFLVVSILIKLTSRGPVLYKHKRVGLKAKTFDFYKFRSMRDSDEDDTARKEMMLKFMKDGITQGESTKIINKNRLTPIGAFLRRYSIDELPQLFNVLKGDMSLVGPRPSLPYEYENYEQWQRNRVRVMPGCTGVWQVTGRSKVSFDESILLDLFYMNRMSLAFDLMIILKTIPVMVFSKGGK